MYVENALQIYFFGLHNFAFKGADTERQRVCFKTRTGLRHETLKMAIARLTRDVPENLTWDPSCGEGSFCLLHARVTAGTFTLPYQEGK